MVKDMQITRRQFLGNAAVAAAFTIVPRHVLGGPRYAAPSEKLNIACIGIGGMGASDVGQFSGENIVALCDVDWKHAAGTFKKFPNAKKYRDFRKMLDAEDKNIDAVSVSTGRVIDHIYLAGTYHSTQHGGGLPGVYVDDIVWSTGTGVRGDFDGDGDVDADDIDLLLDEVLAGTNDAAFDLTSDGLVDGDDSDEWVQVIKETEYGDSTLDKRIDGADLSLMAAKWLEPTGMGWLDGDFTGDGAVDVFDLAVMASNYRLAAAGSAHVPEPTGLLLLAVAPALTRRRRRSGARARRPLH